MSMSMTMLNCNVISSSDLFKSWYLKNLIKCSLGIKHHKLVLTIYSTANIKALRESLIWSISVNKLSPIPK